MEKTLGFNLEDTLFWHALKKLIRFVMVTCSLAATGCIIYSCILRYIFHGNFYGSDEVILSFAFWLYFSGAMYGSYENSHIKADILMTMIKNLRVKDTFGLIAQLVNAVVNLILITWAANYFVWGIVKMPLTTALKIPLVIPQSAIFFGLLVMGFYHIYYLVQNTRRYLREGHFSVPQEGDYFGEAMLQKYPGSGVPSKEEAEAIRRKNEAEDEKSATAAAAEKKEDGE